MKIALRSHLTSHPVERSQIGAGLVRVTCTICPHMALEDAPHGLQPVVGSTIPEWMQDASRRFAPQIQALAVA